MLQNFRNRIKSRIKKNRPFLIVFFLVVLFICVYFFYNIVVIIQPGEGGVKYRLFFGGTVIDKVYSEGFYLIWPWDRMFHYNVRVQQIAHEFDVLTKNGLKVHLYISIRYHPEYDLLGVLHQKVGPNYAEVVVVPEIEQVLRLIIGQMDVEEVYTTGRSIIEKSLNDAIEQVAQRFILVDNVIIKKLQLPKLVEDSIEKKMTEKHLADAHVYKVEKQQREAQRKRIEADMMKEYNDIVNTSLTDRILEWMAIQATLELSRSSNAKVVVVGSGKRGLPILGNIVLNEDSSVMVDEEAPPPAPEAMAKTSKKKAQQTSAGTAPKQPASAEQTVQPSTGEILQDHTPAVPELFRQNQ